MKAFEEAVLYQAVMEADTEEAKQEAFEELMTYKFKEAGLKA